MRRPVQPLVYVSYAWRSRALAEEPDGSPPDGDHEQIVDDLCAVLDQEEKILVGRDKKLLRSGDSIEAFAQEIARGGLIVPRQ